MARLRRAEARRRRRRRVRRRRPCAGADAPGRRARSRRRTHFRLLGRANDLVNIAGKRSSLGHLNYHLNAIDGVVDGAFWVPAEHDDADGSVVRLAAFVVAPGIDDAAILAALRQRVDAAFLPRRIVRVPSLPRDATGKLPATRLAALAAAPGAAAGAETAAPRP
jgi:acyl-coenzyme A synthetase/AMP-(fatty) acid ligase